MSSKISTPVTIRLPNSLYNKLEEEAAKAKIPRSTFIVKMLSTYVNMAKDEEYLLSLLTDNV